MEIYGIYILVIIAISMLYVSLNRKDFTLIFFSGLFFVIDGLIILNKGLGELTTYNFPIGILFLFIGIYVIVRDGLDLMEDKKKKEVN